MVKIEQLDPLDANELSHEEEYTDVSDSEELSDADLYSDLDDDEDDYYLEEESLLDRLTALKDIIPLSKRTAVSNAVSSVVGTGMMSARFLGKAAWVVSTSALVLFLPLALEIEKDQAMAQYEKEAKLTQPPTAEQALPPGVYPPGAGINAVPGAPSSAPAGMAPPGF
ncbi:mitochondrial import receptor subunit Tom22 [Dimargaris verticillata]|uniref:Mitochondrial import receptor subunit Tom22 n=1 Tax=Dimargaris verticillata TaxID=2761393 RepID=A0A9W8B2A8_9FUNG|nr:mitochondrial import receptor subunit Tom22 [Dimargaris verticillata]